MLAPKDAGRIRFDPKKTPSREHLSPGEKAFFTDPYRNAERIGAGDMPGRRFFSAPADDSFLPSPD